MFHLSCVCEIYMFFKIREPSEGYYVVCRNTNAHFHGALLDLVDN